MSAVSVTLQEWRNEALEGQELEDKDTRKIAEELTQFAACIGAGRACPVPLEEVLHGVCVFEAAVESARTRRPVTVRD